MRQEYRIGWIAIFLTIVASSPLDARAEAPYGVAWSRQLGTSASETSYSVAVDSLGNPYISGSAGSGAFLIKHDAAGNLLWSRQLGSSTTSFSVAVDGLGNAYISGITFDNLDGPHAGSGDAFLTKYDASGNLQWSRQVGTDRFDESLGVAVDGLGNAYFSGMTQGSLAGPNAGGPIPSAYDAFLFKYDSSGNLLWSSQIGTTAHDRSTSVAVDVLGNAFISGYTAGALGGTHVGGFDSFLTKYDASGNLLWSRQVGTTRADFSTSVDVDGLGNAFISGSTTGNLGGPNAAPGTFDAFLIKYDAVGTRLWTRQIGTSASDESLAVAVDALGNAYISGDTLGALQGINMGNYDAYLTKYDGSGNLLWTRQLGTSALDTSNGVAVDGFGNAYISGATQGSLGGPNAGSSDAFLFKFSPVPKPSSFALLATGALLLWAKRRQVGLSRHS